MSTSKGIGIAHEYSHRHSDTIFYKAFCDCMGNECIHTIMLEYDKDVDKISMTLFSKVGVYDPWYSYQWYHWFPKMWHRVTRVFKILFTGYLESEDGFLFGDEEAIQGYLNALQEGLNKMKEEKAKLHGN